MTLSPDGRAVAFVHDVDGEQSIVMRDIETGKTAAVAMPNSGRAWIPQSVRIDWINNHRLIFGLREGGFAAIEKDGSQVMGLTGRMGAIDRKEYRSVLSDGVLYAYRAEENGDVLMTEYDIPAARYDGEWFSPIFPHVIKLNSRTGAKVRVVTNPGNVASWLADANGVIRVALETKNGIGRTLYRESADASWQPLPGMDWDDAAVRPMEIGADNHTLYVRRKSPQGMWAVYPYDLKNGKFGEAVIAHELYDIMSPESPTGSN